MGHKTQTLNMSLGWFGFTGLFVTGLPGLADVAGKTGLAAIKGCRVFRLAKK